MKVTISFTTDNDAFQENFALEVERMLTQASHVINHNHNTIRETDVVVIRDSNGNTAGVVTMDRSEEETKHSRKAGAFSTPPLS